MVKFAGAGDVLHARLEPGERLKCESDAIVTVGANALIDASMDGGLFGALSRTLFTGESFFLTQLSNPGADDSAVLAQLSPRMPGDVSVLPNVPRQGLVLTHGTFLAAGDGVTVQSRMQRGMSASLLSGTGFAVLDVRGRGPVAFSGFGSLMRRELGPGEELLVDNGHLVGYTADMPFTIGMANNGSVMASIKSGEGLMCRFTGPGSVFVQSRNLDSLREALGISGGSRASGSGGGGAIVGLVVVLAVVVGVLILLLVGTLSNQANWSHSYEF
mmetsp:Transcript_17380/g.45373  ORF Transcript_17380/g.45373 Transcript_17380/m.45373 type:complete len:273 (-) Transcript_17380:3181-3999(-)|eukprot:CAMPEP_0206289220 /NCGR_PEP_ID=MMETSP0106_2-20121207/2007_1 /ASSEMBLY_ACC=CAM_ASM_000206 /TAXON_ID=81532 /ORGANISM="Acanthoeca-like sp., Strain 10tr" /LENGTH=272 /DNA_ID=CAMNT_0053719773 /DNA_START=175 /DNA_END=993 /DNA_ORIENTATION=+